MECNFYPITLTSIYSICLISSTTHYFHYFLLQIKFHICLYFFVHSYKPYLFPNFMHNMCMYLCVCMFKCQDVDTHMCICGCGCWRTILSVISGNILHLLWDSASPWHWTYQSGLSGHVETPTSLSLSARIGIANAHHHAGHVRMISRNQTHFLRFARQTLY